MSDMIIRTVLVLVLTVVVVWLCERASVRRRSARAEREATRDPNDRRRDAA